MGFFADCKTAIDENPSTKLNEFDRELLYSRIRRVSVRVQYVIYNIAATILLYLFNGSLLNGYIQNEQFSSIITFHFTQLIAIIAYFTTSLSNPGHIEPLGSDLTSDHESGTDSENMKELEIWNRNIIIDRLDLNNAPFGFCWRCKFIRPIRSKHCYDCDRCVGKFDHHCPMVGNCVGGKNHRFFLTFLFFQSIVVVWCFQLSVTDLYAKYHHIVWYHNHPNITKSADVDTNELINLAMVFRLLFFLAMIFAMFVVVGLCGFHCYLSSSNQTTYEMVKPRMLEKWVKEESKRRKKSLNKKRQPKKKDYAYAAVDISDDTMTEEEDDDTVAGKYQRSKRNNNMISFDEGIIKNLWRFWTARMKNEWITPFKCRLQQESHSDR